MSFHEKIISEEVLRGERALVLMANGGPVVLPNGLPEAVRVHVIGICDKVHLGSGVALASIVAEGTTIVAAGQFSCGEIRAGGLTASSDVEVVTMSLTGDADIAGKLIGLKGAAIEIDGALRARAVEVEGVIALHGDVSVKDFLVATVLESDKAILCETKIIGDEAFVIA